MYLLIKIKISCLGEQHFTQNDTLNFGSILFGGWNFTHTLFQYTHGKQRHCIKKIYTKTQDRNNHLWLLKVAIASELLPPETWHINSRYIINISVIKWVPRRGIYMFVIVCVWELGVVFAN